MAAGDAVVKGTNDFTEQSPVRRWVRNRGWQKVRRWEGPLDDTKITTLTDSLKLLNAEEINVAEGWPTVIEAMIPSDSDSIGIGLADPETQTEWSLEPYDLDKSLNVHGAFNLSGSSAEALAVIDKEIKAGEGYAKDYDTIYSGFGSMTSYARLRGQGVDGFRSFGFTLHSVLTCERENVYTRQWQQNREKQGKVITWDEIKVPDSAQIERPWVHIFVPNIWSSGIVYKTGSAGAWSDVYIDEWLVRPAGIRFVREGRTRKRQLVQDYLGAVAWSAVLYDGGKGSP